MRSNGSATALNEAVALDRSPRPAWQRARGRVVVQRQRRRRPAAAGRAEPRRGVGGGELRHRRQVNKSDPDAPRPRRRADARTAYAGALRPGDRRRRADAARRLPRLPQQQQRRGLAPGCPSGSTCRRSPRYVAFDGGRRQLRRHRRPRHNVVPALGRRVRRASPVVAWDHNPPSVGLRVAAAVPGSAAGVPSRRGGADRLPADRVPTDLPAGGRWRLLVGGAWRAGWARERARRALHRRAERRWHCGSAAGSRHCSGRRCSSPRPMLWLPWAEGTGARLALVGAPPGQRLRPRRARGRGVAGRQGAVGSSFIAWSAIFFIM